MNPESGSPREVQQIAVSHPIALRNIRYRRIYRSEDCHISVVHGKPQDTTDSVRQPVTHLWNNHEARLLRRYGTFIRIFLPVYLERHRPPAVRNLIRAGTGIFRHIQIRSLVMVAHAILYVLNGKLTIRLHIQRHRLLGRITLDKIHILIHRGIIFTEERPYTSLASTQGAEIIRAISLGETEISVLSLEISFLTGERNHIRRVHAILLIVKRYLLDTGLVGMRRDTIVRDADRYPNGTFVTRSLTDHLHHPSLVLIGDRERLATAVIAIFLY